mgnify:CR=1 FL=1
MRPAFKRPRAGELMAKQSPNPRTRPPVPAFVADYVPLTTLDSARRRPVMTRCPQDLMPAIADLPTFKPKTNTRTAHDH